MFIKCWTTSYRHDLRERRNRVGQVQSVLFLGVMRVWQSVYFCCALQ